MDNQHLEVIWNDTFTRAIHVEAKDDGLALILPSGHAFIMDAHQVVKLRKTLQRYEASLRKK